MYPNNQYSLDRLNGQIQELQRLRDSYQQPQPTQNIFNVGNNQNIDFEARILNENEKPKEILIQRKTAFIDFKNGNLSIKEINGDIKEYKIILPKDEKDVKIEELENKLKEMEWKLNEYKYASTNNENGKSNAISNGNDKSTTKKTS